MPENTDLEDEIAMICIAVVAIFGLISNGLSLYLTRTRSRFRNAFGILCSSFLLCNLQAIFILLTWCTIVLHVKSQHLHKECSFVFNQCSNYRFSYQDSFIATICANVDTAVTVAIVMAMACIDLTTLIKIFSYRRAMRRNATVSTDGAISEREILFFKQSCILGLLYISCTVTFNVAPHAFNDSLLYALFFQFGIPSDLIKDMTNYL
ncbi:Elongation factor [Dirofilaria immitis]